ncbi:hypothetical protein FRC09_016563 [Ceratobasidium sp. 395]|nr:hypothetical protein FRC09_016563 [Ceratobasidium sp. 395]
MQDTIMDCDSSFKQPYFWEYYTFGEIPTTISTSLYARSTPSATKFMIDKSGVLYPGWMPVCTVSASFQDLNEIAVQQNSEITGSYWVLEYKIGIRFGGTQLSAYIEWIQDGEMMTGPATIIPEALR